MKKYKYTEEQVQAAIAKQKAGIWRPDPNYDGLKGVAEVDNRNLKAQSDATMVFKAAYRAYQEDPTESHAKALVEASEAEQLAAKKSGFIMEPTNRVEAAKQAAKQTLKAANDQRLRKIEKGVSIVERRPIKKADVPSYYDSGEEQVLGNGDVRRVWFVKP